MAYQSNEIARLLAQQEALNKQLAEAKESETRHALREIVQKMREYNISLNELMGRNPGEQVSKSEAKYRDPQSGAEWSGRGRAPAWIVGQDRERFLTDKRGAVQANLFPNLR